MKRPLPPPLPPNFIRSLLDRGLVRYETEKDRAVWFGKVFTFSAGRNCCFRVLWDNFLNGNLPIHQTRILADWPGVTNLSNIWKRHPAWRQVIVGDGNGNFWLDVPEEMLPAPLPPVVPMAVPQTTHL